MTSKYLHFKVNNVLIVISAATVTQAILIQLKMTKMRAVYFALGALDVLMTKCGTPFHKQVAQHDFLKQLTGMLIDPGMAQEVCTTSIIVSKSLRCQRAALLILEMWKILMCSIIHVQIKSKITILIQKWALRFENN